MAMDKGAGATADYLIELLRESGAYPHSDARGRYSVAALTASVSAPASALCRAGLAWRGYEPCAAGRIWAIPNRGDYVDWINIHIIPGYAALADAHAHARLDALASADMLLLPPPGQGLPCIKRYMAAEEEAIRLMSPERRAQRLRAYPKSLRR